MTHGDWEGYLRSKFPAYLLPKSAVTHLSAVQASRFLDAITGRTDALSLVRSACFLVTHAEGLGRFVAGPLTHLVRALPSTMETVRREWDGSYHGRLHVGETLARRARGHLNAFVTMSPRRRFSSPENRVLRFVCGRLLTILVQVRVAEALREDVGWGATLRGCEVTLRRLLQSSALRAVEDEVPSVADENVARAARHHGYQEAVEWAERLRGELDSDDPTEIARLLAEGALLPLNGSTRFELAALIRLAEMVDEVVGKDGVGTWDRQRGLVMRRRGDVFSFASADGRAIRLFYNRAILPSGTADRGAAHYLGNRGRLRPDIVVTFEKNGKRSNALVIECKHSADARVLVEGYHEAVLYRWEYAPHLHGPVRSVLVTSGPISGDVRDSDDVIGVTWTEWPSDRLVRMIEAWVSRAAQA